MSEHYPSQAEPSAMPNRAAMSRLITASIAAYQPDSAESAGMVDQLCLHIEAWLLWLQIFRTVCRSDSDVERLTALSKAILRAAALAGAGYGDCEKSTWIEEHESNLLQVSRMIWDRRSSIIFHLPVTLLINELGSWDDHVHCDRRHLMAFLAELTAAGIGPCGDYFLGYTHWILQPQDETSDFEVDTENLLIIEDHFTIAGPWIKSQFGVAHDAPEHWKESVTYTQERWALWKRNLQALAERSDDNVRASITRILVAMD